MNRNCSTNDHINTYQSNDRNASSPSNDRNTSCPPTPNCCSKVIKAETLGECDNWCDKPVYGCPGPIVVKVPVVLADCKVQIDVEAEIHLEDRAFDVKTIDKKVCITQCHVVPYTNKLFLAGFVQKNIQYSTVECANCTSISGNIVHTTVKVPFKCVTAICFDKWPELGKSFKERTNVLDKKMMCEDPNEDSWIHFNKLQEPIFCELEWAKILETDIYDRDMKCCAEPFTKEACFQDFTEKMVVYVRIKVLQNRSVYIPEPYCLDHVKKEIYKDDTKSEYVSDKGIEVGYEEGKGVVGRILKEEE